MCIDLCNTLFCKHLLNVGPPQPYFMSWNPIFGADEAVYYSQIIEFNHISVINIYLLQPR